MSDGFVDQERSHAVEPAPREARLSELGVPLDPSIAYRLESMFPQLTGWGAKSDLKEKGNDIADYLSHLKGASQVKGELKKKGHVIALVEPELRKILRDGEEVLYIAKGVRQSMFETMSLGFVMASLLNQTVFVLTNARILILRTDSTGKPRHACWMIYYCEIETFQRNWTGSLSLKLKDGRKMTFAGFTKTDAAAMPAIFEEALEQYRQRGFQPQTSQSQENLCSRCCESVPKGEFDCAHCGQRFWTPREVARRSLIFPSWGNFALGNDGIACFEVIGYVFCLSATIIVAVEAIRRGQPIETLILPVVSLAVLHAFDAAITYLIAGKGLHPK